MKGILNARRAACVVLAIGFAHAAFAADILIADAKSQPESLTAAPGGVLIVGSASTPFVYKVRSGSSTAEKFVDATAEGPGTFFLRHAGRRLHEYVMDVPVDSGAQYHSSTAAHGPERVRSVHWYTEDPLESAGR